MADNYSVYTGEAMGFLQGYASRAFATAQGAVSALGARIIPPTLESVAAPKEFPITIPGEPTIEVSAPSIEGGPSEPNLANYSMPSKPGYTIPAVPTLHDIGIPTFIDGTIPPMTGTLPIVNFDVPTITPISADEAVQDSLFVTVRDRLERNIQSGGTMLNPDVEQDIWDRDLERHEQQLQDSVDKVMGQWAKMGFSLPDGLLAGNLLAINNEYLNKRLDRSREIAVKQAELEHTGLFKSLELGISFENIVMQSMNSFAQRRLDAAKANGDILIAVFKERVVLFNTRLEAFKTDALVWKTNIEAEIVRTEVYKTKISALQLVTQVDESRVKTYSAQISAIEQLVKIYNVEVQAVAIQYEAEKRKIELYRGKVDAYAAKVEALMKQYALGVEGFKSEVQAFATIAEVVMKQADAGSKIAIAKFETDIKHMEASARLDENAVAVQLEGLKAAAQAASNLAAGSLSAIHASVSDSYQNTYQQYKTLTA